MNRVTPIFERHLYFAAIVFTLIRISIIKNRTTLMRFNLISIHTNTHSISRAVPLVEAKILKDLNDALLYSIHSFKNKIIRISVNYIIIGCDS